MRLYDTASRAVLPFSPPAGPIGVYVCGITPYDSAHLGHAFTFHVFDVLTRRLTSLGHTVRAVRNITDVDDDMLRVARERGRDYRTIGDEQVRVFDEDMAALRLLPVRTPRASRHVPEMVEMVGVLERRGFAYEVDGWVFFDTRRFPRYGRFSRLPPAEMRTLSARRGADPDDPRKRDPLDFVLWQRSLDDEPSWPSPWGPGRPGWHIECSVLSTAELGAPIEIHGGGDDLIYPHHEAEIAQSEAAGVTPFVHRWMHVSPVMYRGEKMSKSLGNLVFVRDLLGSHRPETLRLLLAAHHYRSSWSYEDGELERAEARRVAVQRAREGGFRISAPAAEARSRAFLDRLDDDLDTPGALAVLDSAVADAGEEHAREGVDAGPVLDRMLELLGAVLPGPRVDQ